MKFSLSTIFSAGFPRRVSPAVLGGIYKEHYAKVLFAAFLGIIALWAWLFYVYAWLPTVSRPDDSVDAVIIPEDMIAAVLEDIEEREDAFEHPVFESVENPFRLPISEEAL